MGQRSVDMAAWKDTNLYINKGNVQNFRFLESISHEKLEKYLGGQVELLSVVSGLSFSWLPSYQPGGGFCCSSVRGIPSRCHSSARNAEPFIPEAAHPPE